MPKRDAEGLTGIARKARDYLWEGRIRVQSVTPPIVTARGSGSTPYVVRYHAGIWVCDCPAQVEECAHIVAASKVVEWTPEDPTLSTTPGASVGAAKMLDDLFDVGPYVPTSEDEDLS